MHLQYTAHGDLFLICMTGGAISEDRYQSIIAELGNGKYKRVISAGLGARIEPSPTQRKAGADILKKFDMNVAIIDDSPFARGMVTVLRWLGVVKMGCWAWKDAGQAAESLGFSGADCEQIVQKLRALRAQVEKEAAA